MFKFKCYTLYLMPRCYSLAVRVETLILTIKYWNLKFGSNDRYIILSPPIFYSDHKMHHEGSRDARYGQACDLIKEHQTTATMNSCASSSHTIHRLWSTLSCAVSAVKGDGGHEWASIGHDQEGHAAWGVSFSS